MEIGKAGMDVIYGLRSVGQQQPLFESSATTSALLGIPPTGQGKTDVRGPLGQILSNPRIWKTFASPDTPFRLFLAPSTRQITVLRPGFIPDPSWLEVPHISAEKLLQIAKDFIAELPDIQKTILERALEQPKWWIGFYDLVGTLGIKVRWVYFRRRRIVEEFERSLPALPEMPAQAPTIAEVPVTAQLDEPLTLRTAASALPESALKRIVGQVVQRMTDSELRALNLPLGYVMDALTTR